jgi:hypothetical protein
MSRCPWIVVFVICLPVVGLTWQPARSADLSPYLWRQRLMLIFAPGPSDPAFRGLGQDLADHVAEVRDRDLLVGHILETGAARLGERRLGPQDAAELRRRYRAARGRFTVVLIGKDGGEKMRQQDNASLQALFDRIDGMPMRQQEMRRKAAGRNDSTVP